MQELCSEVVSSTSVIDSTYIKTFGQTCSYIVHHIRESSVNARKTIAKVTWTTKPCGASLRHDLTEGPHYPGEIMFIQIKSAVVPTDLTMTIACHFH